jgi:hypothetical protein
MTTEKTTGWKGMEIEKGQKVQVDPNCDGMGEICDRKFTVTRIYADGDTVQVQQDKERYRVHKTYVRPLMTSEERKELRNRDMEKVHEKAREEMQTFVAQLDGAHNRWMEQFAEKGNSPARLADELKWNVEKVFADGATQRIAHQYGIVEAAQKYIEGEVQLGFLRQVIDKARERAASDALRMPYRHNNSDASHNLYREVYHQVLCSLAAGAGFVASKDGFGSHFTRQFHAVEWHDKHLEEVANEW